MSSLYRHAALTVLVVSILSGCSSSVTREPVAQSDRTSTNAQAQFGTQPAAVRVTLSPKVENELADNAGFSAQKLQSAFESELNTRQLLATPTSSAAMRLNVWSGPTYLRTRGLS
ncbi:exported hypothetical protein [Paraburkholderia unamae]|uniref:hypothetical protein n=1 Tax=Paraburkholderia unamae TaxID=219649 RepID=UPI001CB434D0|nr:hypothetical protein [Paraburkholderia unamae]CAG9244346.1 exported hypothetical protein [Paraburkholderia unamae]